jgi:hypothetical protein
MKNYQDANKFVDRDQIYVNGLQNKIILDKMKN